MCSGIIPLFLYKFYRKGELTSNTYQPTALAVGQQTIHRILMNRFNGFSTQQTVETVIILPAFSAIPTAKAVG